MLNIQAIYNTNNSISGYNNTQNNIKCIDKKVHIRFKDYLEEVTLTGLEQKLNFLITHLFNSKLDKLDEDVGWLNYEGNDKNILKRAFKEFVNKAEYLEEMKLLYNVFENRNLDIKGVYLLPNYKRKGNLNIRQQFGKMDNELLKLNTLDLISLLVKHKIDRCSISDLMVFLFDDKLEIKIVSSQDYNNRVIKAYTKFKNKANRKLTKKLIKKENYLKLW